MQLKCTYQKFSESKLWKVPKPWLPLGRQYTYYTKEWPDEQMLETCITVLFLDAARSGCFHLVKRSFEHLNQLSPVTLFQTSFPAALRQSALIEHERKKKGKATHFSPLQYLLSLISLDNKALPVYHWFQSIPQRRFTKKAEKKHIPLNLFYSPLLISAGKYIRETWEASKLK